MSDTLDRLKALNSKLEEKLSAKKGTKNKESTPPKATTVPPREEGNEPPRPKEVKPRQAQAAAAKDAARSEQASAGETSHDLSLLARTLYTHLGVDPHSEPVRARNLERLAELYLALDIRKKVEPIEELFIYKAMNISGIGLKEEDFGEIREGKYVQVIAITYEPDKNGKKKAKNISLGYFGKAETLEPSRKNQVIEFVLRWRYEKAFQNLEHYRMLLAKVEPRETLF
ncbi:hypothetical protein [Nitratifractor salsuginis]|uniref:Uncharacterized protein n=1 Tax=Nitratifractor salsuginis (strain DSM 16511 / JCM 12458 / E9I37-1) TaxID=749222 RepID=E6WXT6_NITSE|nr:hypothetical protein [Nitratifractor salsuginis]ADV46343.1 hypothetical protein Nitsa_1087 [Nitratifractor salsuginis DSM 16511]